MKQDLPMNGADMLVGFSRVDTDPEDEKGPFYMPLGGYGNNHLRISVRGAAVGAETETPYGLKATCIAVTGTNGETVLLYTVDLTVIVSSVTARLRNAIREVFPDIPENNIFFTATHTHSGPDMTNSDTSHPFIDYDGRETTCKANAERYLNMFESQIVRAASEAMADRKRVTEIRTGTVDTVDSDGKNLNFVRHYSLVANGHREVFLGTLASNMNYTGKTCIVNGVTYKTVLGTYMSDPNTNMMLVRFDREGGKSVVFVNYRAHAYVQSGSLASNQEVRQHYSPDFVGPFCKNVEEQAGVLCAFYQGDAGNITPTSSITADMPASFRDDWHNFEKYGRLLAAFAVSALQSSTALSVVKGERTVSTAREQYAALFRNKDYYQLDGETQAIVDEMCEYFTANYGRYENGVHLYKLSAINAMASKSNGLVHSYYHAARIRSRQKLTKETFDVELNAVNIAGLAFTEAPYEMFDSDGDIIRNGGAALGYQNVFVMGYSNDSLFYVPSELGFTQGYDSSMPPMSVPYSYVDVNGNTVSGTAPHETMIGSYEADQCQFVPALDKNGVAIYGTKENGDPIYVGEDLAAHLVKLLESIR